MRLLNETEREILKKLQERHDFAHDISPEDIKVEYHQRGNATIAVLIVDNKIQVGYSKYNPYDKDLGLPFIPEVGEKRAFVKAFQPEN